MNKKVLRAMIALVWVFFVLFVIAKLIFSEWFVAVATNGRIIQIGSFIDTHLFARLIADALLSSLLAHLYFCSCKQVWNLHVREYVFVIIYVLILVPLYLWNPTLASSFDLIGLVLIPFILKCNWKQFTAVFLLHQLGQLTALFIRSEQMYLISTNYATRFILVFDMYIWLILYYLYSNLYKEDGTLWECLLHPFSETKRKMSSKKSS